MRYTYAYQAGKNDYDRSATGARIPDHFPYSNSPGSGSTPCDIKELPSSEGVTDNRLDERRMFEVLARYAPRIKTTGLIGLGFGSESLTCNILNVQHDPRAGTTKVGCVLAP
ncbi:MAG: hypothetical protein AAF561_00115 [Planctomycetota bacterium]